MDEKIDKLLRTIFQSLGTLDTSLGKDNDANTLMMINIIEEAFKSIPDPCCDEANTNDLVQGAKLSFAAVSENKANLDRESAKQHVGECISKLATALNPALQ
tara:strand:+ start:760 stop:1065 length:306 start_codon:yes stop_codon:yes gene_type:complete